jgi:hypothetical protein
MSRRDQVDDSIVGERFGRLVVLGLHSRARNRQTKWLCRCDCGTEKAIIRSSLTSGHSRSCGCLHARSNGEASASGGTPEYRAWTGMIRRCTNKRDKRWVDYGGRGIAVCDRWRSSYLEFLADVGRRPTPQHSLDRFPNNDGNYEPGNVRWATAKQQVANRRPVPRKAWREATKHAYRVVDAFEDVLSSYTGARYVICVDSCTAALHLVCAYLKVKEVEIPKYTYVGVPASIKNAGGRVKFRDEAWRGMYRLEPYPVYDCARHLTSGMYIKGTFMCLSFHWSKHLPIGRGGAILCDDKKAAEWLQRAAFDGRKRGSSPRGDKGLIVGWHYYMTPPLAAQGLMLMASIPEHNDPLPNSDYPDLTTMKAFAHG